MGRRTEVPILRATDEAAAREFQQLRRLMRASDRGSLAEATAHKIMDEANRIEGLGRPPTEAVLELREFVRGLGLGGAIERIRPGGVS